MCRDKRRDGDEQKVFDVGSRHVCQRRCCNICGRQRKNLVLSALPDRSLGFARPIQSPLNRCKREELEMVGVHGSVTVK